MKTLTNFALKEKYKLIQSIGDKLVEIDSSIDWKPFRTIFESIYFYKTGSGGRPEADVFIMFKMLILQQWVVFPTLNLRINVLIEFI
jgi:IS5 family transposase